MVWERHTIFDILINMRYNSINEITIYAKNSINKNFKQQTMYNIWTYWGNISINNAVCMTFGTAGFSFIISGTRSFLPASFVVAFGMAASCF